MLKIPTTCPFCGEEHEEVAVVAQIEEGEWAMGRKQGRLTFHPKLGDPVIRWIHLECLLDTVEFLKTDRERCGVCTIYTKQHRWVYRIQIGQVDIPTMTFVPDSDPRNFGYICVDCITWMFGGVDGLEERMEYNELQRPGAVAGSQQRDQFSGRPRSVVSPRGVSSGELVSPREVYDRFRRAVNTSLRERGS